jgi:hypothetical protein
MAIRTYQRVTFASCIVSPAGTLWYPNVWCFECRAGRPQPRWGSSEALAATLPALITWYLGSIQIALGHGWTSHANSQLTDTAARCCGHLLARRWFQWRLHRIRDHRLHCILLQTNRNGIKKNRSQLTYSGTDRLAKGRTCRRSLSAAAFSPHSSSHWHRRKIYRCMGAIEF